jgi:hypothetical protein
LRLSPSLSVAHLDRRLSEESRSGFHFEYHLAAPPKPGERILVVGLFNGAEALEIGRPGGISLSE